MDPTIVDLTENDEDLIDQIAGFLPDCFRRFSPEWVPTIEIAQEKVFESLSGGRRSRVLIDENRTALGWIGAIVDENVWEIHPIAVAPQAQRNGYGARLVNDIVLLAKASGAVAVWAGTSDETQSTSFSKFDLYREAARAMENVEAAPGHAVNFWLKMGFSLVGVIPDEEGLDRPGILFAKRVT